MGEQTIDISLPGGIQNDAVADNGGAAPVLETDLTEIVVTKENVQDVVRSLARPEIYHIAITATNHYSDLVRTRTVDHWVREGNARTRTTVGNVTSNELRWGDAVYLWNTGDETYVTYPVGSFSSDASAGMLTYEDVAKIPTGQIVDAGYEAYEDTPCIHVVSKDDTLGYTSEYYISLDTGMLIYGAVRKDTTPIYSMTVTEMTEGVFDETVFMLPTGQSLSGT